VGRVREPSAALLCQPRGHSLREAIPALQERRRSKRSVVDAHTHGQATASEEPLPLAVLRASKAVAHNIAAIVAGAMKRALSCGAIT
jgi:hypothetical protein